MPAGSDNNDNTLDFSTTLFTKEVKDFKATIFFFIHINFCNIVISFPFHKWGTQDAEKLVGDSRNY